MDHNGNVFFTESDTDQVYSLDGGSADILSGASEGSGPVFGSLSLGVAVFPVLPGAATRAANVRIR